MYLVQHSNSHPPPQHITIRQQAQGGVATIAGVAGQPVLLVQQPQTRATLQQIQGSIVQIQSQHPGSSHAGAQSAAGHISASQLAQRAEHAGFHAPPNGAPQTTVVVQQTLPQQTQMTRAYAQAPVPAANVYIGSQRYYSALLAERSRDPNAPTPKQEYRELKRKFKYLVYVCLGGSVACFIGGTFQENECYQEELRNLQRKLLKLSRDKNFLLDRLANYENASESSEDSDASTKTVEDKAPKQKKYVIECFAES